ncbi:MAG: HD domain-containing protein, partial [Rhodanobacteraceae bacterium]
MHRSPDHNAKIHGGAAPVASLSAPERALWKNTDALLRGIGCDDDTLSAAAWYAVAQVHPETWSGIATAAPEAVRRLVEGQQQAERVWALHAVHDTGGSAEGLRRLLLAIIRDLRVVYLLLARQLAWMRGADALPEAERRALARLTRDIHAPLANRLGIGQWKWELEDLAFRHLQPDVYRRIAELLDERRVDREAWIARCIETLRDALRAQGIEADVNGRA